MSASIVTSKQIETAREHVRQGRFPEAINVLLPIAESGDVEAQYELGEMYFLGADVSAEFAHTWYSHACKQNHPEACYRAAQLSVLVGKHAPSDLPELLERAARVGSVSAAHALGVYYATGDWAGPKDLNKAVDWYEVAARKGDADSQYNFALMVLLGEGRLPSSCLAEEWLLKAAEQSQKDAQRVLADLYHTGRHGFRVDEKASAFWLKKGKAP
jgi:TPR repeat protein